jgi:hypothetical protein
MGGKKYKDGNYEVKKGCKKGNKRNKGRDIPIEIRIDASLSK